MKLFTTSQVREIDKFTIENEPIPSIELMERAAQQITLWITNRYSHNDSFVVFVGPGNNGGDGLAVARMMIEKQFQVKVFLVRIAEKLSPDAETNYHRLAALSESSLVELKEGDTLPAVNPDEHIVDALFGSGLNRPVKGFAAECIQYINTLPNVKIAIDIPSGLFGEDNTANTPETIIRADFTLGLQFPSISFLFPENEQFTGKWTIIPIGLHPEGIEKNNTDLIFQEKNEICPLVKTRQHFSHKGSYGNILLISGCYGMMGAAILAGKAALRSGSGLVTLHIPRFGYQIVQTALPEALVSIDESDIIFSNIPDLSAYSAVGVGPGLGCKSNTQKALYNLISKVQVPLIIDADGLNILSENKEWLSELPENTILTPHPKEFDRIAGSCSSGYKRFEKQGELSGQYKTIIVLKGAYTSISLPDGTCYFNSTGNPGMATAGSGDVLTGIILSLLGQGYNPDQAARLGVYIHGLAGDKAVEDSSEEAIIASDITEKIGMAYREIKEEG